MEGSCGHFTNQKYFICLAGVIRMSSNYKITHAMMVPITDAHY